VRSDPQTSEWHSYFENDVLVSEFAFFLQYIYNTDVGIKRSEIRHDQQMKPVQAGRRNTQGERNMTNKPIYIKIYDKIKSAIKGGTYPPGSFLPTEQELETLYQVSRTTIRKAVKLLSDEGILSVRQGCGTMVMDTRTTQNYNQVTSVTESLRKRGHDVTTGSMMIDVIPASRDIATDLFIPERTPVARIQRLQLADGRPVTLMENYIEYAKVPGIEHHSGHFVALYQFLEENYNLFIDSTKDKISAKSADFLEARVLDVEPKTALLVIRRISYYKDTPVSIDHVRIIGSQYEAEISGKGRSK